MKPETGKGVSASRDFQLAMREIPPAVRWVLLALASIAIVVPLEWLHLPAALLLGCLSAAALLAANDVPVLIPRVPFTLAQGLIGCLVARSLGHGILLQMAYGWPVLVGGVVSVLIFSTALGLLLTRWKVLPGTTAVWGSAPGAATVMVLMSEGFGGDPRLVAFMQYFRVMLVALTASVVSRLLGASGSHAPAVADWFPAVNPAQLSASLLLAVAGGLVGEKSKIPAGALLVPLVIGAVLSGSHLMTLELPPWLLAVGYAFIGWAIGMRFTRQILVYAATAFPKIAVSTATLIALCGGLACGLHWLAGVDPLTAYLATSPGGADSVAIIAASSKADMGFVMAMQTVRFILVMAVGPSLVRLVVSWADS